MNTSRKQNKKKADEKATKKTVHHKDNKNHQRKEKTKLNYMEEKEWSTIEDEIMTLELKIEEIDEEIIEAGSDYGKIGVLYKDKTALQEKLDEKYSRWEYLSEFVH
jgi:hypothetical protein